MESFQPSSESKFDYKFTGQWDPSARAVYDKMLASAPKNPDGTFINTMTEENLPAIEQRSVATFEPFLK